MRKHATFLLLLIVALILLAGCQQANGSTPEKDQPEAKAETAKNEAPEDQEKGKVPDGCAPEFRALFDHATVELHGEGTLDVVVVTDPLCWHCRLGHKLLGEYPKLYGRLRLSFFPRRSFIGSDMAAWILEDAVGSDQMEKMVAYAYTGLKQPKVKDIMEARMLVLAQFTKAFPEMLKDTTIEKLYVRLQKEREPHVVESTMLGEAAHLPGTPILVAGDKVVLGFNPDVWLKVLGDAQVCK